MRPPNRFIPPLIAIALLLAVPAATGAHQGHSPATSEASPVTPGDAWQVTDAQPTGAAGFVALPPDGQYIAGTDPDGQFCVIDIAATEETCDTDPLPIDLESITWAPESSAVAYSLVAFRLAAESDIHVFELATGASVNLTDDGLEGGLLDLEASTVPVDVLPTWSADSQSLTFARTEWEADDAGTEQMTIARSGGEPEPRHTISRERPLAMSTPMRSLADGSLIYAITTTSVNDPENGLWLLDASGEATQVMPGTRDDAYPMPAIADVAEGSGGTMVSGYSMLAITQANTNDPVSFLLDVGSGAAEPLPHPDDKALILGPAGFSPDGSSSVASSLNADVDEVVIFGADAQVFPLGPASEGAAGAAIAFVPPQWADNGTVLLAGFTATPWLLSISPDAGSMPGPPCGCTPPAER